VPEGPEAKRGGLSGAWKGAAVVGGIALLVAVLTVAILLHIRFAERFPADKQDIHAAWVEGRRILDGQNPYAAIHKSDMWENPDLYATYFPLFYELSALVQAMGLRDFPQWLTFWRYVFFVFYVGIGALLFGALYRNGQKSLAVMACLFWMFSRWTLRVSMICHLDYPPIFFLLLAILLLRRYPWLALVSLSVSLALKQIAVFAVPLFLIWVWQSSEQGRRRRMLTALAALGSVSVLSSLPFIVWDPVAFVKSVLFSATRKPWTHYVANVPVFSVDWLLGLKGLLGRVPMLLLMLLVYGAAATRRVGPCVSVLLVMAVFVHFNAVWFAQYMGWLVPLVPLCALDWKPPQARMEPVRSG